MPSPLIESRVVLYPLTPMKIAAMPKTINNPPARNPPISQYFLRFISHLPVRTHDVDLLSLGPTQRCRHQHLLARLLRSSRVVVAAKYAASDIGLASFSRKEEAGAVRRPPERAHARA